MTFMADRLRTAAPGMRGGEPGVTGRVLLDGVAIDPREPVVAAPGSRLTLETPGGGGFGPASERAAHEVTLKPLRAGTPARPAIALIAAVRTSVWQWGRCLLSRTLRAMGPGVRRDDAE